LAELYLWPTWGSRGIATQLLIRPYVGTCHPLANVGHYGGTRYPPVNVGRLRHSNSLSSYTLSSVNVGPNGDIWYPPFNVGHFPRRNRTSPVNVGPMLGDHIFSSLTWYIYFFGVTILLCVQNSFIIQCGATEEVLTSPPTTWGYLRYGRPHASVTTELSILEFALYIYNVGQGPTIV